MKLLCPYCNKECETESELQDGQHVVCPFCGEKFSYRNSSSESPSERSHDLIMAVCPYCGFGEQVDVQYAGQVGTCSRCGKDFTIIPNARGVPYESIELAAPKVDVGPQEEMEGSRRFYWWVVKVFLGIAALLWIWGFITGHCDAREGQNLIGYGLRRNSMNCISASGYTAYFKWFTDMEARRQEVQKSLEEVDRAANEFQRSLNTLGY